MQTIKKEAIRVISKLPEDASIDDIMYKLYVVDKIKTGQRDINEGKFTKSTDLRKEIDTW